MYYELFHSFIIAGNQNPSKFHLSWKHPKNKTNKNKKTQTSLKVNFKSHIHKTNKQKSHNQNTTHKHKSDLYVSWNCLGFFTCFIFFFLQVFRQLYQDSKALFKAKDIKKSRVHCLLFVCLLFKKQASKREKRECQISNMLIYSKQRLISIYCKLSRHEWLAWLAYCLYFVL